MKQKIVFLLALLTFCLVQNPAQAQGIFTPEEILSKYSSDPNSVVGLIMKVKFTGTSSTNWEVKSGSNTIAFRKDDNPDLNANTEYVALTTFTAIEGQPGWYKATGSSYTPSKAKEPESPCNRHYESAVKFIVDTPVVHTFTVNGRTGAKVIFSPGNLQYRPATNEWRFALRQFDRVGFGTSRHLPEGMTGGTTVNDNTSTVFYDSIDYTTKDENGNYKVIKNVPCNNLLSSKTYRGWIDHFGWGTSGQGRKVGDEGAAFFYPYEHNAIVLSANNYYGYGPSWDEGHGEGALNNNFDKGSGTNRLFDWGYANYIREYHGSVFDDAGHWQYSTDSTMYHTGIWRTPTIDEWEYMLSARKVDGNDSAFTKVQLQWGKNAYDTVSGIIIYPDDFSFSEAGVAPLTFGGNYLPTAITLPTWELLQEAGCVFLPASYSTYISNGNLATTIGYTGGYVYTWSSTKISPSSAYYCYIYTPSRNTSVKSSGSSYYMRPVRLVQDYFDPCDAQEIKFKDTTVIISVNDPYYEGTAFSTGKTYKTPNLNARLTKQSFIVDTLRTVELGFDSVYYRITLTYPIFSISATQKATFSPGNLQFYAGTSTQQIYYFAQNQYDRQASTNITSTNTTYGNYTDLFPWGATGTGSQKHPNYRSTNNSDFANWVDWGNCGKTITTRGLSSNIAYPSGVWRTPTLAEFSYLFFNRTTKTGARYAIVWLRRSTTSTDTVSGVVVFPDNFEWEKAGLTAKTVNNSAKYTLTKADWDKLEKAGCAFMPFTGYCYSGASYFSSAYLGIYLRYWTSTPTGPNATSSYNLYLAGHNTALQNSSGSWYLCYAVRLIRDLPKDY